MRLDKFHKLCNPFILTCIMTCCVMTEECVSVGLQEDDCEHLFIKQDIFAVCHCFKCCGVIKKILFSTFVKCFIFVLFYFCLQTMFNFEDVIVSAITSGGYF